jgi:hypothetical protein
MSEPFLRVESGDPTPEELAAVVAVLAARRGADTAAAPANLARSAWHDRSRLVRSMPWPAPAAWRLSGRP